MVSVKSIVAGFEARGSSISPDLQRFLDLVWTNREEILFSGTGSASKLYKLYTREPFHGPNASPLNVLPFLKKLLPLANHPRARPVGLQAGAYSSTPVEQLVRWLADEHWPDRQGVASDAGYGFYHMPGDELAAGATGRIYLNVVPAFSVEVMSFVIRDVLAMHRDAVKAKLSGPCRQSADGIVIWVKSLDRADGVLTDIADYQQRHRAFFQDGVPRLCKEISDARGKPLRGVGVGTEPLEKISFGKSRIIPIFEALSEYVEGDQDRLLSRFGTRTAAGRSEYDQAKQQFVSKVIAILNSKGINPANVHL